MQIEQQKAKFIDELMQQNQRLRTELAEVSRANRKSANARKLAIRALRCVAQRANFYLLSKSQRLTIQPRKTAKSETELSSQLSELSQRFEVRASKRTQHASQIDALVDEVKLLQVRKADLERRLKLAHADKQELSELAKEANGKLFLLEQELQASAELSLRRELRNEELSDANSWLLVQLSQLSSLDERISQALLATSAASVAIPLSAELLELLGEAGQKRAQLDASCVKLRQQLADAGSVAPNAGRPTHTQHADGSAALPLPAHDSRELLQLLRRLEFELRARQKRKPQPPATHNSTCNSEDSGISTSEFADDQYASLEPSVDVRGWRQLVEAVIAQLDDKQPCDYCKLMIAERAEFEALKKRHAKLADELKSKADALLSCESSLIEARAKLDGCEQRVAQLKSDLENCDNFVNADELVKLAWKVRDEAVERKNTLQISLAKSRIEIMQTSSQLMEAVQQKAELSQRLAQFEVSSEQCIQTRNSRSARVSNCNCLTFACRLLRLASKRSLFVSES